MTLIKVKHIIFFIVFLLTQVSFAQLQQNSFENVEELIEKDPKPIVVFIHTDWCMYCKSMTKHSLKNKEIANTLNEDFYFISFNAEQKEPIRFRNHEFSFIPNGHKTGVHQLALELGKINGRIAYPTLVILNSEYEIVFQNASFLNSKQLHKILKKAI